MKKDFNVKGMHCNSCSERIENALREKVDDVNVSYSKEKAEITFDPEKITEKEIRKIIKNEGYEIVEGKKVKQANFNFGWLILIASLILLFFILYRTFGGIDVEIPTLGENTSLILLFVVGILTGFHCVSMCGGFVVSYTTKNAMKGHKGFKQHLVYGTSKLFSYAIIGGVFGLIGGIVAFSVGLRGMVAIFAGVFMIFYALSMFGFKFFKKFQFNPKFLTKIASKKHSGVYKGPFFTGLLSGLFIACGPLQAMYLYAAGSGSFTNGMAGLAAFGLGTLPVMMGFGSLTTVISHKTTKKILKVSAVIVLVLGLIMLNRGLTVMGSPVSYDTLKDKVIKVDSGSAVLVDGFQEINMDVNRYGWEPKSFVLKKGVPVKWNINVKELTGCNNEIIVRDYDLDIKLKKGMNTVEFTPDKEGTVRWSCWMGMIPGSFVVTDTGEASYEQLNAATPKSSGSCGGSCGSSSCGAKTGGGCGCGG